MAKKKTEAVVETVAETTPHSANFDKVKRYYENYLNGIKPSWNKQMVYNVVGKWITAEEYEEITGEPYEA